MTQEQAIALAETGWWKDCTPHEIAYFQLFEPLLCINFSAYHEAVEKALDRPVWTHEFADIERLQAEFLGDKESPTMEEIMNMIPADKRIIVGI